MILVRMQPDYVLGASLFPRIVDSSVGLRYHSQGVLREHTWVAVTYGLVGVSALLTLLQN